MKVYLDNCIVVDLEKSKIELKKIVEEHDLVNPIFLYSVVHLFEAKQMSNATDFDMIERCGLLFRVTQNNYLAYNPATKTCEIKDRHPLMEYDSIHIQHVQLIENSGGLL